TQLPHHFTPSPYPTLFRSGVGGAVAFVAAAPFEQHVGNRFRVAAHQPEQHHRDFVAAFFGEAPNHAEVDEGDAVAGEVEDVALRSEEHTSELQSRENIVCR